MSDKTKNKGNNDCWGTPDWLFDKLDDEFNFTLDVCADDNNAKCHSYYTEEENCLIQNWSSSVIHNACFMNPPYSNPRPFVEKAWEESKRVSVVCVVKVDTSTNWWGTFWDYDNHRPKPGCEIRYLPKRVKFKASTARIERARAEGKKLNGPTFPTAIIIMDRRSHEQQ